VNLYRKKGQEHAVENKAEKQQKHTQKIWKMCESAKN